MSSKQAKTIIYFIFTVCLTLGLSISLQSLLAAWAPPTQPPVSGNVPPPIYSYSTVTQTITGTGGHLMLDGNDFGAWNITAGGNLTVDTNTFVVDNANNRVGIGASIPERELHIGNGVIRVDRSVDSAGLIANRTGLKAFFVGVTADRFVISDMGTDLVGPGTNRLTINNSGDIGIGTISPGAKLDVNGTFKISGSRPITMDGGATNIYKQGDIGGWAFGLHAKGSSGTDRGGFGFLGSADALSYYYIGPSYSSPHLTVLNNGNVGIGLTSQLSTGKLFIKDNSRYNSEWNGSGIVISNNTTGNTTLRMGTDLTTGISYIQSMHVNVDWNAPLILQGTGGNVGIGTANPSGKLDVTVNGASAWAGIFNYNSGSPSGQYGIWTHGSTYALYADGPAYATAFYYSSDASLKKNIKIIPDALDKVLELKGVEFDWKKDGSSSIGLIAQDVEKVFPELVEADKNTGLKSVEYGNLVAPLIEAIKEQQKQIDDLKKQIDNLK